MVTERNYAIWWLNMFREWIPKSGDSDWKSTNPSMSFNPGNRQLVITRWTGIECSFTGVCVSVCVCACVTIYVYVFNRWESPLLLASFHCQVHQLCSHATVGGIQWCSLSRWRFLFAMLTPCLQNISYGHLAFPGESATGHIIISRCNEHRGSWVLLPTDAWLFLTINWSKFCVLR